MPEQKLPKTIAVRVDAATYQKLFKLPRLKRYEILERLREWLAQQLPP
jgi:hypothetical protein